MAWTELTRRQYERKGSKYASDTTDVEWAFIIPLIPAARKTGRPCKTDLREVFDAILYIATTGCQWRMLPNDFPPVSTLRGYFYAWRDEGLLDEMNRELVAAARLAEGRKAQPTRRNPGSRWRARCVESYRFTLSIIEVYLCRRRICRTQTARCAEISWSLDSPDHQTFRYRRGL